MERVGFYDCAKVAVNKGVTGEDIKEFDEDIFINAFGIEDANDLQKIRYHIGKS